MDPREIVRKKRDGGALAPAEIEAFLDAYVAGEVSDAQAAALCTAVFLRGLAPEELAAWTGAMLHSGSTLARGASGRRRVDKHSTGGIGDKVSLVLAPALAACGAEVPMISGRGLGHTGGTLDKLEAIPGLRTELPLARARAVVEEVGVVIAAQTSELVPADKKLYALRDHAGLVESIPLIASSILSKKLAEDLDALVLDVKYGSGAFLPERERGAELGEALRALAAGFGLPVRVVHSSMEEPLGVAVGCTLEVAEAIECLHARGPADVRELVARLGGEALAAVGLASDVEHGAERVAASLDDASARDVFARMVAAQGGDARWVEDPRRIARSGAVALWCAPASGRLRVVDCRAIGLAVCALGGGRRRPEDPVDHEVGLRWLARSGEDLVAGQALAELHHRDGRGLDEAEGWLERAIELL